MRSARNVTTVFKHAICATSFGIFQNLGAAALLPDSH